MSNIGLLFRHDLKAASRNAIALVVLFGVVVIPSFFAWFNVLSSWDPFGNVKNLTVAVANGDDGYESDLFPLRVNVGEQVISSLRANSDLDWVFTTPEQAVAGTESGEYYAALVLPADFSRHMMTFLSPGAEPAQIEYYANEKTNALSPKITGQAATEVSTKINASFTKTLNEVGLALVSSLADRLDDPSTLAALERLEASTSQVAAQLRSGADTAQMFAALVASTKPLVTGADSLTDASVEALRQTGGAISGGAGAARALKASLDSATASLSAAFASSAERYRTLAQEIGDLYTALGQQADGAEAVLNALTAEVDTQIAQYQGLRDGLQAQADSTTDPALRDGLELVVSGLDGAIARQEALSDRIDTAILGIGDSTADADATRTEIVGLVGQAQSAIESAQTAYTGGLQPQLERLANTLSSINAGVISMGDDLAGAAATLTGGTGSLLGALDVAEGVSASIAEGLATTATRFDTLAAALRTAAQTGDLTEVTKILGNGPGVVAGELASPVGLKRIAVFPVDSFGAQMAPFYTVLGLWIGALLLSVLIRVDVERDALPFPKPLTLTQGYVGRYGILGMLAFLQSSLLYTGLIGFVGVTPAHPFLLILAGWVMSLVFSMITYTLVVSFGEAGKALGVVLLVFQISAGGGAYPLSVLPQWFQNLSPFLPVTHATNAVRSAIGGIYQGDYWISLGQLLLFILPVLLLGLVLRRPLVGFNKDLALALEGTKLM
jgi:putative membrane protein